MRKWTSKEIREFRKSKGLIQKDFGELLGVTRTYVIYLETGRRKPSKVLKLLLDCLETKRKGV
mgnify:CR=1 FL=1